MVNNSHEQFILTYLNILAIVISLSNFNIFLFVQIEFFTVYTKLAEMAILASKDLRTPKKKLLPVGLDLMQGIITAL